MANRIKELRKLAGLSQEELAQAVGTTFQQISRLEKDERKISIEWMEKLAPALKCAPWELMDNSGGGLSSEEKLLLENYRKLGNKGKKALNAFFDIFPKQIEENEKE